MINHGQDKEAVRDFWDAASCGEELYLDELSQAGYQEQARSRYELEPYIPEFAGFAKSNGKRVLEIGLGLGADHQRFAEGGADLFGVDLTPRSVEHVRRRFELMNLRSEIGVGDAEGLGFSDDFFDVVYSWGVLHHSPNTQAAVNEVHRVLRPGGEARVMIYHTWSLTGFALWIRYGLLALRPWRSLADIYAHHLESPGTKAYTAAEARRLFARFRKVDIQIVLSHSDLLSSASGQRHRGRLLDIARRLWPRRLLQRTARGFGLYMLIVAVK